MSRIQMMQEEINVLLDYSEDDNATTSFQIPAWALFVGVFVPNFTNNADVGIEVSRDGSAGTFYPVIDVATGNDLVICGSGDDPGFVDISDYIRPFVGNRSPKTSILPYEFRFTLSAAEDTADTTWYVIFRG